MKVYIVHCVDTEGPMNETLEATFSRIQNIFHVSLDPTEDNLRKLQRSEIPLGGVETAIANLVSANRLEMKKSWLDIGEMLRKLNEPSFRFALTNDEARPWIFTWFCLDHVGFTGANPRRETSAIIRCLIIIDLGLEITCGSTQFNGIIIRYQ